MDTLTMVDDETLRRLRHQLRHYDKGVVIKERVRESLGAAHDALRGRFEATSSDAGGLMNLGADVAAAASEIDSRLREASAHVSFYRFSSALELVSDIARRLDVLDQRLAVRAQLERARQLVATISREVGEHWHCVERLRELRIRAGSLYMEAKFREGGFVVGLCLDHGERLTAVSTAGDRGQEASRARVRRQRDLESRLSMLQVPAALRLEIADPLATIERQIGRDRVVMAEALLEELEIATNPAAVFVAELDRRIKWRGPAVERDTNEWLSRAAADGGGWEDATSALLARSLDDLKSQCAACVEAPRHHGAARRS
jgi:hypothetical protein